MKNINQQAKELIREHLTFWELARQNYAALEKVQTRRLEVNGYPVILQFNPERIRSSAAKINRWLPVPVSFVKHIVPVIRSGLTLEKNIRS